MLRTLQQLSKGVIMEEGRNRIVSWGPSSQTLTKQEHLFLWKSEPDQVYKIMSLSMMTIKLWFAKLLWILLLIMMMFLPCLRDWCIDLRFDNKQLRTAGRVDWYGGVYMVYSYTQWVLAPAIIMTSCLPRYARQTARGEEGGWGEKWIKWWSKTYS